MSHDGLIHPSRDADAEIERLLKQVRVLESEKEKVAIRATGEILELKRQCAHRGWPTGKGGGAMIDNERLASIMATGTATVEEIEAMAQELSSLRKRSWYTASIEELGIGVRSYNCLTKAKIKTVGELTWKTEAELLQIENLGRTSLNEIKKVLAEQGLALRKEKQGDREPHP